MICKKVVSKGLCKESRYAVYAKTRHLQLNDLFLLCFAVVFLSSLFLLIFSSPEPKAHGELIVYQSSRRLSGCHWVGGKDALGFGPDRIRTLVSMATDSSHRN